MPQSSSHIEKICILGGGTAGWMTAAALSHKLKGLPIRIELVESDEIGTVGVGEATLPLIRKFNEALNIDEAAFMKATEATFKLGIEFCNWGRIGDRYIHPFGDYGRPLNGIPFYQMWLRLRELGEKHRLDEWSYPVIAAEMGRFRYPASDYASVTGSFGYAYQFDASRYAAFLRQYAEANGVIRTEGKVAATSCHSETGFVEALNLDGDRTVTADLFVDCSGFRGLLIEQALKTGYDDWSHWLPCNRAIAVPCESHGELTPFTRATARDAGWQWRIPLQHRVGNGHVYCSSFISDDEATAQLMANLEGPALASPKQLYFTTGRRRKFWNRNVIAIGLAAGFLEPLESTSIHLIQEGITELIQLFPDKAFQASDSDEYNARMGLAFERVRDFLLLHYVANQREDGAMWLHFQNLTLPESLEEKISAWMTRGHIIRYEFGTFLPPSWLAVLLGQNMIPRGYDPRVLAVPEADLVAHAQSTRESVLAAVRDTPQHDLFIRQIGAGTDRAPLVAKAG
ncbi:MULTISPECIES: tryptophan halogenase family protein [Asticcacaulis]|uniref:tryptophan halogenase family protein n=1 Tax=Asticcacaulis TaxID=76890 RepID=UPI001AE1DBF2|nr:MULTISPECIES: tryptophan halogenase family protein [Asticcacaulis]